MKLELYKLVIAKGDFDTAPFVLFKSKENLNTNKNKYDGSDNTPLKNEYSSLYVGEGFKAVVYSGINFTGIDKIFPAGRYDNVGDDWSKKIMSIKLLKKDDPYISKSEILKKQIELQEFEVLMTNVLIYMGLGIILVGILFLVLKRKQTQVIPAIPSQLVGGFKKINQLFKKIF